MTRVDPAHAPGSYAENLVVVDLARAAVTGYELLTRIAGPPEASPDA